MKCRVVLFNQPAIKKANYPVDVCLRGNCSNRNIKKEEGKERDKIRRENAKVWSPIATNSFVYFVVTQTHSFAFNCLETSEKKENLRKSTNQQTPIGRTNQLSKEMLAKLNLTREQVDMESQVCLFFFHFFFFFFYFNFSFFISF